MTGNGHVKIPILLKSRRQYGCLGFTSGICLSKDLKIFHVRCTVLNTQTSQSDWSVLFLSEGEIFTGSKYIPLYI